MVRKPIVGTGSALDSMALEVERLLASGDSVVRQFDGWTVMADPEGNEFCALE